MAISQAQAYAVGSGTNTATASLASTPTEGNLLIAVGSSSTGELAGASLTGWTLVTSAEYSLTAHLVVILWYKIAGAAESKDVTLNWTTGGTVRLVIEEWRGLHPTSPLDKSAKHDNDNSTYTSWSSGTTATTSVGDELWYAAFRTNAAVTNRSFSNSFTKSYDLSTFVTGFLVVSATAAAETTYSWTTAAKCGGLVATFKVAPAANPACYIHARRDRMNTKGVSKQDSLA